MRLRDLSIGLALAAAAWRQRGRDEDAAIETVLPVFASAVEHGSASFSMVVAAYCGSRGMTVCDAAEREAHRRYYGQLVNAFIRRHGRLVHVLWADNFMGGLALAERKTTLLRRHKLELAAVGSSRALTALRQLGFRLDRLIIEARRTLLGDPQKMAIERIYSVYADVFTEMDARANRKATCRKPDAETRARMAALEGQVRDVEVYVHQAAERQAKGQYLAGMFLGVATLIALAVFAARAFQGFSIPRDLTFPALLGSLAAGAIGAMLSVMLRMTSGGLQVAWDESRYATLLLGGFRAIIGALSGGVVYLFISTGLVLANLAHQTDAFYWAVGVLAGFSERWAPGILTSTEKALSVTSPGGGTAVASREEPSQTGQRSGKLAETATNPGP